MDLVTSYPRTRQEVPQHLGMKGPNVSGISSSSSVASPAYWKTDAGVLHTSLHLDCQFSVAQLGGS